MLRVHDGQVFVHEYIYETIKLVRENRTGGVWQPDELVRLMKKIKEYKEDLFTSKPAIFFSRIQLWGTLSDTAGFFFRGSLTFRDHCSGKSVDETKKKFYALREMYHIEKPGNQAGGNASSHCIQTNPSN